MVRQRMLGRTVLALGLFVIGGPVACGGSSSGPTDPGSGAVQGAVLGPGSSGVEGATLSLSRQGQATRTATSGGDGSFAFEGVVSGSWTLSIAPPSGLRLASGETNQRSVNVPDGGTVQETFLLVQAQGEGSVAGSAMHSGAGVGSVELMLRDGEGASTSRTTNPDGSFFFGGLTPGEYELEISPPSWFGLSSGEAAVRSITVGASQVQVQIALTPDTPQQTVEIEARALTFVPSSLTVAPGTRVRWINQQAIFHTVTPSGHTAWTPGSLSSQGQVFEVVLNNPGDYSYFCEPHVGAGMSGAIVVQP